MIMDDIKEQLQIIIDQEVIKLRSGADKLAKKHANALVRRIKNDAPVKTGKYKKSWKSEKTYENAESVEYTVRAVKHFRLSHLLEHGHGYIGKDGQRKFVKGIPHINNNAKAEMDAYLKEVEELADGG